MSRRGKSTKGCNDHDLVHPTVYHPTSLTSLPSQYNNIVPNPEFKPMKMDPIISPGPILPNGYDSKDPEALFRLLFDDRILDRIVRCTNLNAASKQHERAWRPVSREDILSYLGILIFFGLDQAVEQKDYWNTSQDGSIHAPVRNSMSRNRWQQIHAFLHIYEPQDYPERNQQKIEAHEKVEPIAQILQENFSKYFQLDTNVAVDECIQGFRGRCTDIVNIPTKPTPIGFKIWCLAEDGYIMDFLWHRKGDKPSQGPQGLQPKWKEQGFRATHAVVLELVSRMRNSG